MAQTRRDYGSGSIYQRASDGLWVGTLEAGWTASGSRRRVTVSARTRREVVVKLRQKKEALEQGLGPIASDRTTIKQWAEHYLELRRLPPRPLRPNAWNAAASPIRKWIIPTIGHKRLADLTPADVRAVAKAQYDAGRKTATADATQRVLITMLNRAVAEGYVVPPRIFKVERPGMGVSDRTDLSVQDTLACLAVASTLPHGTRWALALLYGVRQGEMLGLVEDSIDFDRKEIRLEWQLDALKYVERGNPAAGFEVPRDYEARHLVDAWHLVRPKSKQGIRVLPLLDPMAEALREWLEVRPENPWGLVYPTRKGRPCNDKIDREEWWAIQYTASVTAVEAGEYASPLDHVVFHPGGERYFHVHECRNFAATQLDETGASDAAITSLLGHASIVTSNRYIGANIDAKRDAIARVAERLGIG